MGLRAGAPGLTGLDIGSAVGREQGITEAQITDLSTYRDSAAFNDLEKTAIDYAFALTVTPSNATDELVAELRRNLDERQLVELTALIAWENFRARFNRGFDVAAQGFSQGAACPIPHRPDPVARPGRQT